MRRDALTLSVGCGAKPDDTGWPGLEGGKMARRGEPANVSPTSDFALSVWPDPKQFGEGSAHSGKRLPAHPRFALRPHGAKEPAGSVKPFVPIVTGWLVHFGKIERF
jgi:hypothetical protein